jgi:ABC-type Zn uptake system ZnuABC Zn-binding protein ZnuA
LEEYQEKLERLHREIITTIDGFSRKKFISYHSAWNYFARRYGLEEIAAVEPFPGQEPSARWLAQLVHLAKEYQVDVLFAEPQLSSKTAKVIAGEIKGRVLILDPLGGAGIEGRECYLDLIRFNLEIFRVALE